MANLFDGLQNQMFDTVTTVFGYDATWQPSAGGEIQSARVLFKDPTQAYELSGVEYTPFHFVMEYRRGFFDGLIESVRRTADEQVTVSGKQYWVRQVHAKYDGKDYIALLELQA